MKRTNQVTAVVTIMLALLLTGCNAKPASPNGTLSSSTQAISNVNSTALNDFLALQTENYQNLSLKDFNATVKKAIDTKENFLNAFSKLLDQTKPSDSEYSFIYETLNYSINEIISEEMDQSISLSHYLKVSDDKPTIGTDKKIPGFMFTALYSFEYRIIDDTNLTVQSRDELLRRYQVKFQEVVSKMTKDQLTKNDARNELQKIASALCEELSANDLTFENAEIQSIEIHDSGNDYQR